MRLRRWLVYKFKKKYLFAYSTNLLISNYTHIGFKKNLTIHSYKKALLGFYSNVAIIHPSVILSHLRYVLHFILKLMLRGRRVCFAVSNFPEALFERSHFKKHYYFFNCWISGYLTNTFSAKKATPLKKRFCPRLPSGIITFGYEPGVVVDIAKECNKKLIPSFSFIDSHINPSHFSYWIPMNSKSGYVKLFFINSVNTIVKRSQLMRQLNFAGRLAKTFRGLKLKEWTRLPSRKLRRIRSFLFFMRKMQSTPIFISQRMKLVKTKIKTRDSKEAERKIERWNFFNKKFNETLRHKKNIP